MSISNVSHTSQVLYGHHSSATNKSADPRNAGVFAAMLSNAGEIEQVQGVRQQTVNPVALETAATGRSNIAQGANIGAFGNNGDHFARVLAQAQNNFGISAAEADALLGTAGFLSTSNTNGYSGVANSLNIGAPDTAATQAAQIIGAIESAKELAAANASGTLKQDPAAVVNLENKVMDFTSMLPEGMRSLLSDLNASDSEKNSFVNVMVFGNEDGPHGKMATEYFGASSMTGAQLSEKLSSTIEMAKVNPAALQSKDYNYLLRHSDSDLGNSLALEAGASLQERTLDRSLDDTFRSDMAMMQILGRSTAQSASLF